MLCTFSFGHFLIFDYENFLMEFRELRSDPDISDTREAPPAPASWQWWWLSPLYVPPAASRNLSTHKSVRKHTEKRAEVIRGSRLLLVTVMLWRFPRAAGSFLLFPVSSCRFQADIPHWWTHSGHYRLNVINLLVLLRTEDLGFLKIPINL